MINNWQNYAVQAFGNVALYKHLSAFQSANMWQYCNVQTFGNFVMCLTFDNIVLHTRGNVSHCKHLAML